MTTISTILDGVIVIEPKVFVDERGWFREVFSERVFAEKVLPLHNAERFGGFMQENESFSKYGVIRGLHYQLPPKAQGKLVRVVQGRILDVALDIREGSPTFGQYAAVELDDENGRMLWVPRGFAHGFSTLSDTARVVYLCDEYYDTAFERSIAYNDASIGIDWRIPQADVCVSQKDAGAGSLENAEFFIYTDRLY